jgi:hypothetical protein
MTKKKTTYLVLLAILVLLICIMSYVVIYKDTDEIKFCGGIEVRQCPAGYRCQIPKDLKNVADIGGACVK